MAWIFEPLPCRVSPTKSPLYRARNEHRVHVHHLLELKLGPQVFAHLLEYPKVAPLGQPVANSAAADAAAATHLVEDLPRAPCSQEQHDAQEHVLVRDAWAT